MIGTSLASMAVAWACDNKGASAVFRPGCDDSPLSKTLRKGSKKHWRKNIESLQSNPLQSMVMQLKHHSWKQCDWKCG